MHAPSVKRAQRMEAQCVQSTIRGSIDPPWLHPGRCLFCMREGVIHFLLGGQGSKDGRIFFSLWGAQLGIGFVMLDLQSFQPSHSAPPTAQLLTPVSKKGQEGDHLMTGSKKAVSRTRVGDHGEPKHEV